MKSKTNKNKKNKKSTWFTKVLAGLGIVAVLGAAVFSIMWFVPGIHDKVWQPAQQTTQTEQQPTGQENKA